MALLSLHNVSMAFGGPLLLDNVSLDIEKGQRICFLGRNGAGKSTFIKILSGEIKPDSGEMIVEDGLRISCLPQDVPLEMTGSVFENVAMGAGETERALTRLHQIEKLSTNSADAEAADLHHVIDLCSGWHVQSLVNRIIFETGLEPDAQAATLSGGMRRRVLLAQALAGEPELLLLDEPTNHLDIDSIAWLESYITESGVTLLFVTHDRRFLKKVATRIVELDRGRINDWSCDYSTFLIRKQAVLDAEELEWARFDKKLAQEEVWIRRGIKARRTRNEGRVRALIKMRDERRKRRERGGNAVMGISAPDRTGDRVIEVENMTFSWGAKPLVSGLNICITRGDKIGIIGPNGCGKTTLLNLLLGRLKPVQGSITHGSNIKVSYYDQLRTVLDPQKTVWENLIPSGGDTVYVNDEPRHIVSYLQDFLFTPDRARSPVSQQSGGERNRLILARLFTQPANVLVFDEPTNDLDSETLELLEELLSDYKGVVLVVSHDREFLNNVVTSNIVYEGNGVFKEYIGGYDDWERTKNAAAAEALALAPVTEKQAPKRSLQSGVEQKKKLSYKEIQMLTALPVEIEALELEHEKINDQMAQKEFFIKPGFVQQSKERIAEIEKMLNEKYAMWQELESRK